MAATRTGGRRPYRITVVIDEVGGCDEAERFFDAVVIVLPVHLGVRVAIEADCRVIGVLVVMKGTEIRAARVSGVDGVIRQDVVRFQVPDV